MRNCVLVVCTVRMPTGSVYTSSSIAPFTCACIFTWSSKERTQVTWWALQGCPVLLPLHYQGYLDLPSFPQPAPHCCFSHLLRSSEMEQGLTKQTIEIQAGEAEGWILDHSPGTCSLQEIQFHFPLPIWAVSFPKARQQYSSSTAAQLFCPHTLTPGSDWSAICSQGIRTWAPANSSAPTSVSKCHYWSLCCWNWTLVLQSGKKAHCTAKHGEEVSALLLRHSAFAVSPPLCCLKHSCCNEWAGP